MTWCSKTADDQDATHDKAGPPGKLESKKVKTAVLCGETEITRGQMIFTTSAACFLVDEIIKCFGKIFGLEFKPKHVYRDNSK